MKKMFFVVLVLIIAFSGCSEEESTGGAIKSETYSLPLKEAPEQSEVVTPIVEQQECNTGESRPCIAIKDCSGISHCVNGAWMECTDVPNDGCPESQLCDEEWECEEWQACKKGVQLRKCVDSHECKTELKRPDTIKLCTTK